MKYFIQGRKKSGFESGYNAALTQEFANTDNSPYCIRNGCFLPSIPTSTARWVPTASKAEPCTVGGTKPASSSSCPSCVRCKNKTRARNTGGRQLQCLLSLTGVLSNVFLKWCP